MTIVSGKRRVWSLFLLLFLYSCIADDFDKLQRSNWDPEFAIPLVDSRIGMERLVGKYNDGAGFTTDDEDVVVLLYEGNILDVGADSLIKLEEISFDLAVFQKFNIINYPSPNFLLRTIDMKAGRLEVHIEDDIPSNTRVTLNLPKTTKDGLPFQRTFTIPFSGSSLTSFDTVFSLANYVTDLSGNGNEYNKLEINFDANEVSNNDSVDIDQFIVTFKDLEYNFIDGNLGNIDMGNHDDTLDLDVFDNFKSGRIVLQDPKINLDITNSFGLPIALNINNISGSGSNGNSSLTGDAVGDGINVPSPGSVGDSSSSETEINNSNSNIAQFLSITPDALSFSFGLEANSGSDTSVYNFVTDKSRIRADLDLKIPMKGSLDSVIIEDIYAFDHSDVETLDEVIFKMVTYNTFPVGIYVQVYFLDENNVVLDSLTDMGTAIFREANTDADGFSLGGVREESFYEMGEARFDPIRRRVENMKIRIMLLTDDSKHKVVKLRSTDYFDFKMGVKTRRNL